ncbi:MAG: neutral zinc metallopeptidase [Xanthobacteraceae bacterium]
MKWEDYRRSDNVEDRRGQGGPGGGMGFPIPMGRGGGGLGIGGLIILGLLAWFFGIDPRIVVGIDEVLNNPQIQQRGPVQPSGKQGAPSDELGKFVAATLAQTEDVWRQVFSEAGRRYEEPRLVLFSGVTRSACGTAQSAMGPFYCPLDKRVYLDTSFFRDLRDRFRAPGDFAAAYVISHEVGHHVQNLLGILPRVQQQRQALSPAQSNALSVRTELQADCFAGVWAHHADNKLKTLEPGDIEKALAAAAAIGDDRMQRQTQGTVVPESFTHGSSQQRMTWFMNGVKSGSMQRCNTFAEGAL